MTTTKPRFHGRCRLGRWLPLADVLSWPREEQPDTTTSRWDKGQACEVAAVQCDFETEDPTFFDAHMATVHERKLGSYEGERGAWTLRFSRDVFPVKMWRGPKLTEAGKAFEPKDLEPGAPVTWTQDGVERTGHVWSGAPYPKSVWVIPDEPLEDERAVCLKAEKSGELYEHLTWTGKDARRMVGAA